MQVIKEKIQCYNNEAMIPPKLGDVCIPKILIVVGKESHNAILDLGSSFKILFFTNLGTTPTLHLHKHVSLFINMAPLSFVQGLLLFLCLMLNIVSYYS
jgi:hypothetical protein